MDVKVEFSFLKLYNSLKGVGKPEKEDNYDAEWL